MTSHCRYAVNALALTMFLAAPAVAFADELADSVPETIENIGPAAPEHVASEVQPGADGLPDGKTTPLQLRSEPEPNAALETEPDMSLWYQLLLFAVVAAGGLVVWRKYKRGPADLPTHQLNILTRTSVGVRSELLVVEVDGRKMLLGVTPQAIAHLDVLDGGPSHHAVATAPAAAMTQDLPPPLRDEDDLVDGYGDEIDDEPMIEVASREPETDFAKALGEIDRRLARYESARVAAAPRSVMSEARGRTRARDIQGGRQASSLLRLAKRA